MLMLIVEFLARGGGQRRKVGKDCKLMGIRINYPSFLYILIARRGDRGPLQSLSLDYR